MPTKQYTRTELSFKTKKRRIENNGKMLNHDNYDNTCLFCYVLQPQCPEVEASFPSRLTFEWITS